METMELMELNLSKEPVFLSEVIYDGQTEQGVEFDYVLPDYFPDIFKVLKCTLTPTIISYSVSGSQLFCDGVVYIKVLYLTGGSNRVHCIEQRYTYSKTIDLVKNAENAAVIIQPKTDYCNCRATSGRRIDVRGAVSCKIKVHCARKTEMITGAEGLGVETKKTALSYCGEKLSVSRQFVSREDIETGASSSGSVSIIHHDVNIAVTDCKVIANKVIVKGEAQIKALYIIRKSEDDENNTTEVMEAAVPVSQIMDLEGVSENHVCFVNLIVMDCDLEVRPGEAGETRVFACDLTIDCSVTAHLESNVSPVSDIYSTDFETSFTVATIKAESLPHIISQQLNLKSSLECTDGELAEIFDARCDVINVVCRARGTAELTITGQMNMQAIGVLDSGVPVFIEKSEPFELTTEVPAIGSEYSIEPNLQVTHVAFSISADNRVDIRVNLSFNGCLYLINSINVIRDIAVNQEKPKEKKAEYALKLYYAEDGEDVWGIAKRYNTSADAIITENDLEGDRIEAPSMLLIPIV
jgi:LysM repeat protein